jgi:SAM-dependent methyltransferase
MKLNIQIKSKKRVIDHGEVLTAEREVNAMLDLVKNETERIESRFLDPACGNGNFLAEILSRKLYKIRENYSKNHIKYEKYSVLAVSSIYGVELLLDNVKDCIDRLFNIFDVEYSSNCRKYTSEDCRKTVNYILSRNILCGDALTMKSSDGSPIIFSEWSFVAEDMLKRRDFRFDELLQGRQKKRNINEKELLHDNELKTYIAIPIKEFSPINYTIIDKYEE